MHYHAALSTVICTKKTVGVLNVVSTGDSVLEAASILHFSAQTPYIRYTEHIMWNFKNALIDGASTSFISEACKRLLLKFFSF
jgi:hypothetical protein